MAEIQAAPEYAPDMWVGQRHRYLVYLFAYNEGERLNRQLKRFPDESHRQFDIMVGDDGTTDGSTERNRIQPLGVRGATRLPKNSGLSANIQAGIHWLFSQDYDGVIFMNGNDRDDPEAIPRFISALEKGYDYVQGSRFLAGGRHVKTPRYRYWAIRLLHAPLFSLAAGRWMSDTTNGYRAFSLKFLRSPELCPFQPMSEYEIEQYLAWYAVRSQYRVTEIPVVRTYANELRQGMVSSKIRVGVGWWLMLVPLLRLHLRRAASFRQRHRLHGNQ